MQVRGYRYLRFCHPSFLISHFKKNLGRRTLLKVQCRTENFTLKLRAYGTRKITSELNAWLNKAVNYQEKEVSWNYVIFLKTRELAHHLIGKKKSLDLVSPKYQTERQDSDEVRKKIQSITYTQ